MTFPVGLRKESISLSLINLFSYFLFCSLDRCLIYFRRIVNRFLENHKRSYWKLRKEMFGVRRNAPEKFPTGLRKESISLSHINLFSSFLFCSLDKCLFYCILKRFLENHKRSYLKLRKEMFAVRRNAPDNFPTGLRKESISPAVAYQLIFVVFVLFFR